MGMYTELVLHIKIKSDVPDDVSEVLEFMFNHAENDDLDNDIVPNHNFFKCDRWFMLGGFSSYENNKVIAKSEFKNYDNEIDLFIDWIKPYLNHKDGDFLGTQCYELDTVPTTINY